MAEPLSSNPPVDRCEHGIPRQFCTAVHKPLVQRLRDSVEPCSILGHIPLDELIKLEAAYELAALCAAQAEAVRILSAIEFDGQAYEAIQRACKLLTNHGGADTREDSVRQARDTPCDATSSQRRCWLCEEELEASSLINTCQPCFNGHDAGDNVWHSGRADRCLTCQKARRI